ncbi:hypothetical protein ASF53_22445 [Methylobacterium sp. Leaf123]|nr:hypothetical protein ASF53_22445 [Methylobacterium sp. Leaf123]
MIYEGTAYAPEIASCSLALNAADGRWRGQEPEETVGLTLSLQGQPFTYDVPADEDEHLAITPTMDTQWLELPTRLFAGRGLGSLDGLDLTYEGPRAVNPLTGETWREPPGLLGTYGNEAFGPCRITVAHRGSDRFALHLVGQTEAGTGFDVAVETPLTVALTSYTGQAGEDRLRRWFDGFLRWDDFSWERVVHPGEVPQHSLTGTLRA